MTQPSADARPVEGDDLAERGQLAAARRELLDLLVVLGERDRRAPESERMNAHSSAVDDG